MTVAIASQPTIRSRVLSLFEFWPGWLFYLPVVAYWILLAIRHRGLTLPTAANPRVETGGLCGERKTTVLDAAGPAARRWIAPYVTLRAGDGGLPEALGRLAAAGICLPVVVKPDIGCNGTGVRLAESADALREALGSFPPGVELVLQELVPFEGEAGIFYVREPGAPAGRITSLTLKQSPVLVGDGQSTVRGLILADERARRIAHVYMPRLSHRLDEVLPAGAPLRLVFAGNHCKGSIFVDGCADITQALTRRVDAIMRDVPEFHFGRLDVRFASRAVLRLGEQFRIIEINGVGSEATHIWDPATSLRTAYADQFRHYRMAFEIGAAMRARGSRPTSPSSLFAHWRLQRRLMASYPLND